MKYLALGDSYTVGENIDYNFNFPSQVVSLLNQKKIEIKLDKLIAVTGWTTDELALAISKQKPTSDYDLVTLLIGVNNQYRGRSLEEYETQFYSLLSQSILFAKGNANQVIVLSIPDWGLTPFNENRDRTETSIQIDEFNKTNLKITQQLGCQYIDITASTREHANNEFYLADDKLHYSKEEYHLWALKIVDCISLFRL